MSKRKQLNEFQTFKTKSFKEQAYSVKLLESTHARPAVPCKNDSWFDAAQERCNKYEGCVVPSFHLCSRGVRAWWESQTGDV